MTGFDYRDRGEVDDDPERRVSLHYLAEWLVHNGLAEAERGYGHVSGIDLAEALLARFTLSQKEAVSRRNHPSRGR